jgi:two-component system, LytTR family, sensor kinase
MIPGVAATGATRGLRQIQPSLQNVPAGVGRTAGRSLVFASGRQVSSGSLFLLLHWGGWISFAAIPFAWSVSTWGLLGAFLNNGTFVLSGGLITLALRFAYRRARASGLSYAILAPTVLVGCGILATIWYVLELFAARRIFSAFAPLMGSDASFNFGLSLLLKQPYAISSGQWYVYAFTLLTWSSLYFGINSMIDLELERARVAAALKLADTARLRVLQSQLNPHFLFNSLNGVATLIRENKGSEASKMVSTLSDFLRATLHRVNVPQITISEELVFLDQYVELQQLRFTDRLHVEVDVQENTYAALIPTLILQPLIENAVQHGVLMKESGGSVLVSIKRHDAELRVLVEDDGPGPAAAGPAPFGVGLTNTAERLRTIYGDGATMTIGRAARGGFAVALSIPFRQSSMSRTP